MTGRRSRRRQTGAVGALAALLVVLLLPIVGHATTAAAAQDPAGDASFRDLGATPSFPTTIRFDLTVESPEEIVRAELLFAPRWVETLNLIQAEIAPGEQVKLEFSLDMYQNYFPPGLDLLYRWRVTDAAGLVTESDEQVVLWEDTRFEWQELATDQVSVFFYSGNQGFNQQILQSAQQTIDEVQAGLGVERSRPLRLWIYDSREDFSGAQQPNSEPWFVGASYSGLYLILSVIPDGNEYELDRIVPHEVTHQLLYQAGENPFNLPARWLDEGIAVYNQDSDKEGYAQVLAAAANEGRLIPLAGLHRQFPFDDSYHLAYAQSLSVVEFIIAGWSDAALGDVIDAYRAGVSHDEAMLSGLGVTVAELEARWHESLGYQGTRELDDGTGGPIGTIGPDAGNTWGDIGPEPILFITIVLAGGVIAARRLRLRPRTDRRRGQLAPPPAAPSARSIDAGART